MSYKVVTPVATEPVTLAEARLHVRLTADDPTTEDALILAWITAAREYAEGYTGRALATQTLEMALDEFPDGDIELDMPPVASVTHIKYTDENGAEQTFSAASYALSTYAESRRVSLAADTEWPETQAVANAVRVRYVSGGEAPKAVKAAILLIVGHLYENRQEVGTDALREVPMGAKALLDVWKVWGC